MFRKKIFKLGIMAAVSAMLVCGCEKKGGEDDVNYMKNNDSENVIYLTDNDENSDDSGLEKSDEIISEHDAQDEDFGEKINMFAFDLYDELSSSDENVFFSPYSVISALSVLDNAAGGDTKTELEYALYISDLDERNNDMKYLAESFNDEKAVLNTANSAWVSKNMEVADGSDEYFSTVKKYYGADVIQTDFTNSETVDDINNWISDKTEGMIPRMLSDLSTDTEMCLVNAVYFKGEWTTVFEVENTQKSDFYGVNGIKDVDMMFQYGYSYQYTTYNGLKGIRLPYGDEQIAMDIWIADNDDIIDSISTGDSGDRGSNAVEIFNSMTNEEKSELFAALDNALYNEINTLGLPSFEVETDTMNITECLKEMGIEKAFSPSGADFSIVNEDLYVTDVFHKAKIKVDECGTEAAAATAIVMETCAVIDEPQEIYNFIADQPFIYAIRDTSTGTILFMGSYVEVE